jgi:hypothetical protein
MAQFGMIPIVGAEFFLRFLLLTVLLSLNRPGVLLWKMNSMPDSAIRLGGLFRVLLALILLAANGFSKTSSGLMVPLTSTRLG